MESSVEVSQTGGTSSPKPALAPKPRLTPKPFSLQKNTTIRSINAPKTARVTSKTTTQQTEKSKAASVPKPPLTTPARKPPQQTTTSDSKPSPVGGLTKDLPKTTRESKASPHGEDTPDSGVGKSDPVTQTAPPKETPESEPTRRDDVIQANHKASADVVNSAGIDGKKKEDKTQTSVIQSLEESASDVSSVDSLANRWGGSRKRLSMELTSRFESAGLSLPPQPTATISTTGNTEDANKPEPSDPEPSLTTPEPSNIGSEEGAPKEDYSGGGSIKRRISLLFDSSSRPEALTKRDELENVNGTGSVKGVKERIKKWAAEKTPEVMKTEKQPRVAPRNRSKSFEPATAPTAEKTPKIPPAEPPVTGTLSSQAVGLSSKAEQPMETSTETSKDAPTEFKSSDSSRVEHTQNKSAEGDVQLRNRSSFKTQTATDEGDSDERESGQHAPKRDNVKRRSVRFGVVERDDGGPPVILGSATDSSEEEEEEASEDEAEKKIPVSVPVYTRVGSLQRKDDDDEERLKHLEFERRRRAEEHEQAPLKLEEERQQKEEEERERERARQKEEEERERERARQKEEEERERERARQKEEEERERERARQKEEEERERERARQKEEEERERERARQKEEEERERERRKEEDVERQKKEERERERLQEEERKRERLREEEMEREKQMQLLRQRQREEERERAKQKEERLKQDQEEREKERLKEEEREKERLKEEERKEERLREERENQKLREKKINKKKEREEEWEQEWVKRTESLRGEEEEKEREKELELMYQRKTEEDRERARQNEERLSEERERQRLREERLNDNFEDYRLEGKLREKEINKKKQREEEWEQEWLKKMERLRGEEEEKEREKELELMYQRKTEEDRERARQKEERLRQEEREEERLREEAKERERERQRRLKEHEEKEEEMERVRRIESERQIEEERRKEERKRQAEKERVEESERRIRQELDRKREQEVKEKLRLEEERGREERERAADKAESNLISFDSEDVPQKSESPNYPVAKSYQPTKSQVEVVYDDFSVRPPLANVDFDDFSVKPKRWGSQVKVETSPPTHSWSAVSEDKEDVQAPPDTVTLLGYRVLEQVEKPDSPEPTLAQERPEEEEEEEEQLISMEVEEEEGQKETQREEAEETNEDGVEEEDEQESQAPVNSYSTNDEDTDALISNEPDEQNGACEQTSEIDSPKLVPDQVPEVSEDVDTTDFPSEPEHAPFPESSTNLLDTSAQRSKADLGKRRNRTRPPSSLRGGFPLGKSPDWRLSDSTDGKEASSKQRDSDSEEEQPKPKIVCSPPPTSQRVPMFPGLSPAALIAQLKKRTTGGGTGRGEEAEGDKGREEKESQNEEVALPPSQQSRSPRPAAHLAGAARVLPPIGGMDGGAVSSPAWLKELKSKKRLSQYDSET
ncbi:182 kDa tankyrase-1-binding protein [Cebidichthys violaceus]|uniref:182 kDa tankyrase-1-binding protein n=1 Tax=Cebidichthys violaceus TaxID=271503 RepID=UPI0035CA5348